jgi:MFS family permease
MTGSSARFPLWAIVLAGCLIAMTTFGPRSTMGFFLTPMVNEYGWSRETFSLAIAIQNLMWGAGQPFFGAIADRYGTARVLVIGAVLYGAGLAIMSVADTPLWLHVSAGLLIGLGVAASSFGIVLAAFGRAVTPEKRTIVFGFGTAAGSFGQFLFSPLTQAFITNFGWSAALQILAAMMIVVPLLAIVLQGKPTAVPLKGGRDQSIGEALSEAMGHRSYVLLVFGFFVCGFHVAFITAHLPAYIRDMGLDPAWGAWAIALIGLFNIVGSLASGVLSGRYSKPIFLALIYLARSVVIVGFLLLPLSPATLLAFSALMGLLWLSTVPPTNGLVAIMFGTRYLAMLGGLVFFSHQIGSFLGVWLGGYLYDVYGSYDVVWWLGVALGVFAAVVHWPIEERPVDRLKAA